MGKGKKKGKKKGDQGKSEQEEEEKSAPPAAQPPPAQAQAPQPRQPPEPRDSHPGPRGDTPYAGAAQPPRELKTPPAFEQQVGRGGDGPPRAAPPHATSPPVAGAGLAGTSTGTIPKGRGRGRGRGAAPFSQAPGVSSPKEGSPAPAGPGVTFGGPPEPSRPKPQPPPGFAPAQPQQVQAQQPSVPATPAQPVEKVVPGAQARPPGKKPPKEKAASPAAEPMSMKSVESALTSVSPKKLTSGRRDLGLRPPKRKDFGKLGRPIRLRANHFEVRVDHKLIIHHYDVDIASEKECPKVLKRRLIDEMMIKYENVFRKYGCVFDGEKNLYSNVDLGLPANRTSTYEITLVDGRRTRNFRIAVKYAATVYLSELIDFLHDKTRESGKTHTAIQALDIAMRHFASTRYLAIGRSVFPITNRGQDLGEGVEMWRGYYQSIRPQWKTLHLNLDVSNRAFVKTCTALEMLCDVCRISERDLPQFQMGLRERDDFLKAVKGLKVEVMHTPIKRSYKIMALSAKPASMQTFPLQAEDGTSRDCTVAKYFIDQYHKHLKFPNLPCLQAQPLDKHRYLPIEVCVIPEGQLVKKLNEKQTANMIRAAARPAPERKQDIEHMMRGVDFVRDPYLKSFGLSVSDEMVKVNGRVLPAPGIIMEKNAVTRDGVWDVRNNALYQPAEINPWGLILCVDQRRFNFQNAKAFVDTMSRTGRSMGIRVDVPLFQEYLDTRRHSEVLKMFQTIKGRYPNLKLIVVILPGKTPVYAEVKRAGDTIIGIATQCVQQRNAEMAKPQTISNIFLKINAKLGGINNIVNRQVPTPGSAQILREPVIILGADVTHPPAGDKTKPSIAAIIGSLDKDAVKYKAKICVQEHRVEIIVDLKNTMIELLKAYKANTGAIPKRIIFYRDGVGEGQFYQVLQHELMAIRDACTALNKDYQPGITFLVVQKRHHTRLFCEESRDAIGRSQNVPPGTTVDTTIIHPVENDFYLCSHNGIQGTSRPTHYHVLWDDNNYSADILQMFTYELCHIYVRCTRSVSIPAPAYYAHHAAFRARHHLEELQSQCDRGGGGDEAWLQRMQRAVETHPDLGAMYFT